MALTPFETSSRRTDWVAAILITVVVGWLHLSFVTHAGGLWRDEVNLVNLAGSQSLGDMAKDSFPALMPLSVRGWVAAGFGRSDMGLRFLGALIGFGLVAALWASAWMARRSPPLLGLVLVALNSTVITYGDSLRGYGLGSLLIVLTLGAAAAFLRSPSPGRTAWLALSMVLSVQALYQNAVFVGAIGLGAALVCARRRAWHAVALVIGTGAIAAVSLLPYLPTLTAGRSSVEVLRTDLHFKYILANLAVGTSFPLGFFSGAWLLLALAVVVAGFAVLGRRRELPVESGGGLDEEEARLFAGTTLVTAVAGFAGFLWLAGLPTQPWYFVPLLALAAATFDAGLPALPRFGRVACFGFVVATALLGAPVAQHDLDLYRFTNVDRLSRQLLAEAAPEDFVVVTPWYCGISFNRYFTGPVPWTTLPPLTDHATHHYDLLRVQMQDPDAIKPVLDKIASTLKSGRRVWVVSESGLMDIPEAGTESPYHLPPPPLPNWGWSGLPYTLEWASQTAHFISNHSLQFEPAKIAGPANLHISENLDLFVASGWRVSSPTSPPAAVNPP